MKTWAMIQNGTIVNTVYALNNDPKNLAYIWVDITNYSPIPGVAWTTTDNVNFTAPSSN